MLQRLFKQPKAYEQQVTVSVGKLQHVINFLSFSFIRRQKSFLQNWKEKGASAFWKA